MKTDGTGGIVNIFVSFIQDFRSPVKIISDEPEVHLTGRNGFCSKSFDRENNRREQLNGGKDTVKS